jgi:hypothetical protein
MMMMIIIAKRGAPRHHQADSVSVHTSMQALATVVALLSLVKSTDGLAPAPTLRRSMPVHHAPATMLALPAMRLQVPVATALLARPSTLAVIPVVAGLGYYLRRRDKERTNMLAFQAKQEEEAAAAAAAAAAVAAAEAAQLEAATLAAEKREETTNLVFGSVLATFLAL